MRCRMNEDIYFGTQLGVDIWNKKYRNDNESFDSWLTRVSGGDPEVHQLIKDKKFMFGGRILANRGIEGKNVSMSNCYYLGIKDDSLESIYETAGKLARIFSAGGGVGIDLSTLAPRGAKINNAAKTTSGAVSFVQLFNITSELIGTEGRRAALLLSLKSEHPDLLEFIDAKANNDSIMKANLSVQVSDKFMNSVIGPFPHVLSFTRHNGDTIESLVDANDIMDTLVKNNYNWAEPGIQYIGRMKNYNMMQYVGEFIIEGTNACSELPLPDDGACLLGSINLSEFVTNGEFDYYDFNKSVRIAVGALNDVLDEGADKHPLKEQCDVAKKWRQIGLGVMGYADALIKLGITYGSDECIEFTGNLSKRMFNSAIWESSINVNKTIFSKSDSYQIMLSDIIQNNCSVEMQDRIKYNGLRNATLLSIAPTGSISTMLGISGGIEPHYALSYTRRTESLHGEPKSYEVEIPIVKEFKSKFIRDLDTKEMQEIAETGVLPSFFVTAKDIHWKERLRVQEAWQNSVDASISSTINLPEDTTEATIKRIYIEAWQRNLKGITIYRDNCSRTGVLSETKEEVLTNSELAMKEHHADRQDAIDELEELRKSNLEFLDSIGVTGMDDVRCEPAKEQEVFSMGPDVEIEIAKDPTNFKRGEWNKLSDDLTYIKRKIYTGCGKLTLFIGYSIENSKIEEIYIKRSGKGGCARSLDALAITMSSMLRLGGNIENIEQAFEGLEPCSSFVRERAKGNSLSPGSNCAMAMLKELQQFIWECGDEPTELLCDYDELVEDIKDGFMIDTNGGRHAIDSAITTKEEFIEMHNPIVIDDVLYVRDSTNQCPECKSELQHTGGCVSCNCGYTRCD